MNELVDVNDTFCDVKGIMLITSIQYHRSIETGTVTVMTLQAKDSFTPEPMAAAGNGGFQTSS